MNASLSEERDRLQRQVEQIEQSLVADINLLSSETDEDSDDDEDGETSPGLLAKREKIQSEIQNLENVLGSYSPASHSDEDEDDDDGDSNSGLGLSQSVESCLDINLVYQQILQETLNQLEELLCQNQKQQREVETLLSGPTKDQTSSPHQPTTKLYLGHFMKPYFKDRVTCLGPPANPESQEKSRRTTGCMDERRLKAKKWETWQKTLLIHAVSRDHLRQLIKPKLSKADYLTQKMNAAVEADRPQLKLHIESLEREVEQIRQQNQDELIGDRYCDHDWQRISNIDFEGTRQPEDLRLFWQNFLHPSINKSSWSREELHQLRELGGNYEERHWDQISRELGNGRTAFMCLQTFQRFVSNSLRRGAWTKEEDAQLVELVDKMRIGNFVPYTQISYFMVGRDVSQLVYRWNHVLDSNIKKGPWSKHEDQLLLSAVARYGERNWWKIRFEVPGRTDGSCRDRYYDTLKEGTKKGPFDQKERALLRKLVEKHGVGRWAKISLEIPNRNDGQCLKAWKTINGIHPIKIHKGGKTTGANMKSGRKKRGLKRSLEEEEEEEEEVVEEVEEDEDEDEDEEVPYMDSDDEMKSRRGRKKKAVVKEVPEVHDDQEIQKEPDQGSRLVEWIPRDPPKHLFQQVAMSSSGPRRVRGTLAEKCGRSVHVGPCPQETKWPGSDSTLLMMLATQKLQGQLCYRSTRAGSGQYGRQQRLKLSMLIGVLPWVGNVMFPLKTRLTAADLLREEMGPNLPPVSSFFRLLLHVMSVDTIGCKEVIKQRTSNTVPPIPHTPPTKVANPKTVRGMLQTKRCQEEDQRQKLPNKSPVFVNFPSSSLKTWILTPSTALLPGPPSSSLPVVQGAALVTSSLPAPAKASPSGEGKRLRKKTQKALESQVLPQKKALSPKCSPGPAVGIRVQNQPGKVQKILSRPNPSTMFQLSKSPTGLVTMVPSSPVLVLQSSSLAPRPHQPAVQPACPLRDGFQLDHSLMFSESREEVNDWLRGQEGVVVPGLDRRLPYMPPCVGSLNMLSELLRARKSFIKSSTQLLSHDTGPETTGPETTGQESAPATSAEDPGVQRNEQEEQKQEEEVQEEEEDQEELVQEIRSLVKKRYAGNAAYETLKARVFSFLTVPSLLATVQPCPEKTLTEDEQEDEEVGEGR